jgi:Icc-related predicted phosphoesterase
VDVYVDESAVTNPYKIIGKGYVKSYPFTKVEEIQEKAILKAKEKGADAVLIKDYYVPNTGAAINTSMRTDSIGKGTVSIGQTTVQQTGSSGFNILFLKYN